MRKYEPDTNYLIELLEHLHVCGERLFDALVSNEMASALALLAERDSMILRLSSIRMKPDHEALRPLASSLRAQNDRIVDALDLRRQSIEAALQETGRVRHGQAMYAGPLEQRSVLRAGLTV